MWGRERWGVKEGKRRCCNVNTNDGGVLNRENESVVMSIRPRSDREGETFSRYPRGAQGLEEKKRLC